MNGSEFQQIWRAIEEIQDRLTKIEQSLPEPIDPELADSILDSISDNYGS